MFFSVFDKVYSVISELNLSHEIKKALTHFIINNIFGKK